LRFFQPLLLLAGLSLAGLCLTGSAAAHDIPTDVATHILVKPNGQQLQLLVRAPLGSMRDVEFPEFGPGYLDVEALSPQLSDLATLWIVHFVEIYERETRLPAPRVVATQVSIQSDRSFASFEQGLEHVTGPKLPNSANVV
jgi:hypothetical protein